MPRCDIVVIDHSAAGRGQKAGQFGVFVRKMVKHDIIRPDPPEKIRKASVHRERGRMPLGMDGAGDTAVLIRIVLPLSAPILAVLTLFYAVGPWNSYFDGMMYLRSLSLYNIQLILRIALSDINYLIAQTGNMVQVERAMMVAEASKYVIIVISMLPVLIIYPFVQKYFIKGIMIGALKG
jgi:hypothetical protein